jgi:prepilin-type N-terminal cleavage/methylation domain-containing protein
MLLQSNSCRSERGRHRIESEARRRLVGRVRRADGFSLLELLAVLLIMGVLAAVSIPLFLSATAKAADAQAKTLAGTAENTAEVLGAENDGQYEKVTVAELVAREPTIPTAPGKGGAYLSKTTDGANEYSVTATATNGDELTIARNANGTIARTCVSPVAKTGCGGRETSSW